jgi:gluconolactonase
MKARPSIHRPSRHCWPAGLMLLLAAVCACAQQTAQAAIDDDAPLFTSTVLTAPGAFTGGIEGPACDAAGMLYVVNFERQGTIGRVASDGTAELFVELPTGSTGNGIRFGSDGTMYVADYAAHNILQVDMTTRQVSVFAHESEMNQPNDVAIDAQDRIYASDPNWSGGDGQLWRIDPDGSVQLLEADIGTTNGIEVGPGEDVLYVGESSQRRVWAYDLDAVGKISNKRLLIQFPDFGLDGIRCDVDGNLLITRYGKGMVVMVTPAGEILREIQLNGSNPSNIAFGGPDGRTCYVTVADQRHVETFRVEIPGRSWQLYQQRQQSTGVAPRSWGQLKGDD